jgi:hypothetical protein
MSETTIETNGAEAVAGNVQVEAGAEETARPGLAEPETEADDSKPGREAAKYRRQLRETEGERDVMASQLEAARGELAEAVLRGVLAQPAAFWLTGAKVGDFFGEDGRLDAARLRSAAQAAAAESGLAVAENQTVIASPTLRREGQLDAAGAGWSSAFGPKR